MKVRLLVGVFCAGVGLLGAMGITMGLGYLKNRELIPDDEDTGHVVARAQHQVIGQSSVGAGVGVIAVAIAMFKVITDFLSKQDAIYRAVVH
jgi:hypothetical protein